MKGSNLGSIDFAFNILSIFDIGGSVIARKEMLSSPSALEYDMNQLHNDYLLIAEDYNKSTVKLCSELQETLKKNDNFR